MNKKIKEQQSLILESLDYARMLARKFYLERKYCGFGLEDFESAAFLGLCDAARRYDSDTQVSFSGFAFLRIQGEMNDLLRGSGFVTRKQVRAIAHLLGEAGKDSSLRQILRAMTLNLKQFQEMILESGIRLHFDDRDQVVDISYADSLDPEETLSEKTLTGFLRELIGKLTAREQLIIELKYFEDLSFEEMRVHFNNATRSWLCRIHSKAIKKLHRMIVASQIELDTVKKVA